MPLPLLRVGAGAVLADPPVIEEPAGEAIMVHATDPEASLSFRGITYTPERGKVTIPAVAVADAISHGFTGPIPQLERK